MPNSRSFILLIVFPVVLLLVLAAAIFGGQGIADHFRDRGIQQAIAATLETSSEVELANLQKVKAGYAVCGLYRTSDSPNSYASFFYDTLSDRLTLDVNSRQFQTYCNLLDFC